MQIGGTALEDEARRRAFEGFDKPIVHQGVITDTVKEYSDTLAIFLLKAHFPEKYRERSSVDLTVATLDMTDDELRAELAALAAAGVIPLTPSHEDGSDLV